MKQMNFTRLLYYLLVLIPTFGAMHWSAWAQASIAKDDDISLAIAPRRGDSVDQLPKKIFVSVTGADPLEGLGVDQKDKPQVASTPVAPAPLRRGIASAAAPTQKSKAAHVEQFKRQPQSVSSRKAITGKGPHSREKRRRTNR